MAKNANTTVFLEDWLKGIGGYNGDVSSSASNPQNPHFASPARAIIQSWSHLRDSIKNQSFQAHHLQSLKSLTTHQASLHVADPQAKLVLSILSSPNLSLPPESYPLFLRLLYVWLRKSARLSPSLVGSVVEVVSKHIDAQFARCSREMFSEAVLLLGSVAFVSSASDISTGVCLDLMCRVLEENYRLMGSFEGIVPSVLAGIGYAVASSANFHYVRMMNFLFGVWGWEGGPGGSLSHGLMIFHLIEWVTSRLTASTYVENISVFSREALEIAKKEHVPFAVVMAAAGALRTVNKSAAAGSRSEILCRLRNSAEERLESVAGNLRDSSATENDPSVGLLLQCFALALSRSGPVSPRSAFLVVLASALLTEIFPLRRFYVKILESFRGNSNHLHLDMEVKKHVESVHFKEAGTIASVFCKQYVSVDEDSKSMVENLIWDYCRLIYVEHRKLALVLRGEKDELLVDIEKITESAFLMVVVFALTVTKQKLDSKLSNNEIRVKMSIRVLVAFSALEYFRRIRLPEYMDTIREVVLCSQENESACASFVESIPTYTDLVNGPDLAFERKTKFVWYKDEVQTSRILFYLRVIATCIDRLPRPVFGKVVAPVMFLYLGHPNEKIARASHSTFAAFMSSGKDSSDQEESPSVKEQLVFYYIERSLLGYPGITPIEGMASGVYALVRHLPAGSPAIFYCIHCLVEKANSLCREDSARQGDSWKNWQGESEPCKKLLDLLLRLTSLVDIQVLPELMKLMAQLIVELPKDGQIMVLNELYSMVAESDDVTRKPTLVSWLQSVSYLCFHNDSGSKKAIGYQQRKERVSNSFFNARL